MSKINKKLIVQMLIVLLLGCIFNMSSVEATASASISASSQSIEIGDTVNIEAKINSVETWTLGISASGGSLSGTTTDTNAAGKEVSQTVISSTFTASQAGTYTITLTGEIAGSDLQPHSVQQSVTITVKAKQTSSGGGTTTGGNTGDTPKEETPSTGTTTPSNNNTSTNQDKKEPTFTEVNETVYVKGTNSVNVRSGPGTSYKNIGSLEKNASITRTGIGSNGWSRVSYNGQTAYISSSYLTTTKPEEETKSSNTYLGGLTLDVEGLTPEFNKDTDSYTLQVGEEVEKIAVTATPEEEKSTVTVEGNEALQIGENKITITVTAEDGTTKTYTITVNKGNVEATSLGLTSLAIKGIDMEGIFSPTTYEYTIELNQDVSELEITAEPNQGGATVEVIGNSDLQEGENIVNIIVKSADGEETVTYQLTIQKNVTAVASTNSSQQNIIFIGLFVGIAVILVIVVSVLIYKRHKKKIEEEYDFGNGEDDTNLYHEETENEEEPEDVVYQNSMPQGYTDTVEDEEEIEEKPKRKKGKHF